MRHYEDADIDSAELLLLGYQHKLKEVDGLERDEQGRMAVMASDVKPNLKFGSTWPNNLIIVSSATRQMLEGSGLIGLRFDPVTLRGRLSIPESDWPWELHSTLTLPKLANTHKLIHRGRGAAEPFQGDYSREVLIDDEPFFGAELHYRRSDLTALGAFDIANTFEKYSMPHPMVISQRFYQYCLKHKIRLNDLKCVRIDPD